MFLDIERSGEQDYKLLTHYHTMENIVRKGEIACNEQFLLFSQCFLPYMALIFSSPEHEVLRVSYCDSAVSVVRRKLFGVCTL